MKKNLCLVVALCSAIGAASFIPYLRAAPAAAECSDCGCGGPKDGKCPKEKGKSCKCEK
jgi:hypothetical protein